MQKNEETKRFLIFFTYATKSQNDLVVLNIITTFATDFWQNRHKSVIETIVIDYI